MKKSRGLSSEYGTTIRNNHIFTPYCQFKVFWSQTSWLMNVLFHLAGQVDFGNKVRIQKLQKDLKMLEQVLDTVDEEKARKVNINVPNKRQFVEPERSAIREDDSDQVLKRYPDDLQYQLCPDTVDRLECFESYMVLWLHMVGERQGKKDIHWQKEQWRQRSREKVEHTPCRRSSW